MAVTVFQIVRELITNVVKHASATRIDIDLWQSDDELRVCVADDGVGFELDGTPANSRGMQGGFGLFSIRERIRRLRGECEVQSSPGRGARISITLPLSGSASCDDQELPSAIGG